MTKAKDFATIGTMFSPAIERRIAEEKQDAPSVDKQVRKPANKGKK